MTLELEIPLGDRRFKLSLTSKKVTKSHMGKYKRDLRYEKWLLSNYSIEELKRIAVNTRGCRFGKCPCNRDCTANSVREVLKSKSI